MGIKALTATGIILGSLLAHSFATSDCSSISDGDKRLACYDAAQNSEKPKDSDTGKWIKSERVSPIDDSPTIVLALESPDKVRSGFMAERPILIVRCQENTTSAYIDWGTFISTGKTRIVTRMDKDKAKTETWSISSDNEGTFPPNSISFIKDMLNKESLIVRVTPFNDNSYTVKFDITGLDNAIKPVRETCGW